MRVRGQSPSLRRVHRIHSRRPRPLAIVLALVVVFVLLALLDARLARADSTVIVEDFGANPGVVDPDPDSDRDRRAPLGLQRSWLGLGAFYRSPSTAASSTAAEIGFLADVGLAWDSGPPRRATAATLRSITGESGATLANVPSEQLLVTPRVARAAVRAAFREAHVLPEDAFTGLASRARWSGIVPEVRLRAGRLWDESARTDLAPSDAWRTSDALRANLWVEGRAVFRLDRLMFADEELAVVRLRIEQSEVAQRIALRVVATLAAWQRAYLESRAAPVGSVSALEASLKLGELEASLDALTGGWFSAWRVDSHAADSRAGAER